jgi:hypothetical protein
MNGGVVGVFIAPTTKSGRWSPDLWARLGVRCTPDIYCSLSGVPEWARLTPARAARAFITPQVAVGAE